MPRPYMNLKTHKLPRIILFVMLLSVGMLAVLFYFSPTIDTTTSALTYSSSTDVSFTFSPKLSISMSDTNLVIDTLVPGQTSTSNAITITVASNTPYGYSLFASVGNNTDHNTTSLTHEDSNIGNNAVFTSIATNASLPELNTDNTWGYTYRTHNTNNTDNEGWSNYNGLPLYSTVDNNTSTNNPALLIDTKSPADSTESIDFKIAAKASTTQASGTYNNVINFYAVGKPKPMTIEDLTYMQDLKDLSETDKETVLEYMPTGKQYQLIDNRDNQTYWLAKQADGKIWMTQNLDLCIGCEGTAALTSQNTDLNEYGHEIYNEGYNIDDGKIRWSPTETAITSNKVISKEKNYSGYYDVPNWINSAIEPSSAEGGDVVIYTSDSIGNDVTYSSVLGCTDGGHVKSDCEHYKIGNYYNWTASVASNNSNSINTEYYVAANSICPAGWRLPQGSSYGSIDFGSLFYASNVINSQLYYLDEISYVDNGFKKIRGSPLYYTRGGNIGGAMLYTRTIYGYYYSGTIGWFKQNDAYWAQNLSIFQDELSVRTAGSNRSGGFLVRCVMR